MSETAVLMMKITTAFYCITTLLMIISYSVRYVTETLVISTMSSLWISIAFSFIHFKLGYSHGIYFTILWFIITYIYWEAIREDLRLTRDMDYLEAQYKQGK